MHNIGARAHRDVVLPRSADWDRRRLAIVLFVIGGGIVAAIAAASASAPPDFAASAAVLVYWLIWRDARPSLKTPISPLNVAHALFIIQLIAIPVVAFFNGYAPGTLLRLPTERSTRIALVIQLFGYAAFCAAYHRRARVVSTRQERNESTEPLPLRRSLRRFLAVFYLGVGICGAYFLFGGVQGYLQYFSRADEGLDVTAALDHTLAGAAATFLRPFLGVAIVLIWSLWTDRGGWGTRSALGRALLTGVASGLLVLSNASYNRGSVVAPLLSLLGAHSLHVRRLRPAFLVLVGIVGTAAVVLWGAYRASGDVELRDLLTVDALRAVYSESDTGNQLQVYGQGPQFLGFFLEETGFDSQLWYGRTIVASLLYPVPILGTYFRPYSAVAMYNQLIYNDDTTIDQMVPFAGELLINFHLFGVAAGYALLGIAINALQRRFLQSSNAFDAYVWCMIGTWTAHLVVGNLAISSQIFVFFFWPFYVYGLVALWSDRRLIVFHHQPTLTVAR